MPRRPKARGRGGGLPAHPAVGVRRLGAIPRLAIPPGSLGRRTCVIARQQRLRHVREGVGQQARDGVAATTGRSGPFELECRARWHSPGPAPASRAACPSAHSGSGPIGPGGPALTIPSVARRSGTPYPRLTVARRPFPPARCRTPTRPSAPCLPTCSSPPTSGRRSARRCRLAPGAACSPSVRVLVVRPFELRGAPALTRPRLSPARPPGAVPVQLKEKQPGLSLGEVGKATGEAWGKLSDKVRLPHGCC